MGRTEGSRTQAAMLADERLLPGYERHMLRNRNKPAARPEMAGYTRDVQEIHKMHVTLTMLLQVMARNFSIPLPPAPIRPSEVIEAAWDDADFADMENDIRQANERARKGER